MQKGKKNKVAKPKELIAIPDKIRFDYLKSDQHREILVEGVHGGLSPKGRIQMSLFCERSPIPRQVVHKLTKDGKLGPEIPSERLVRDAIIRSVEVTLMMDLETGQAIYTWLGRHLRKGKELIKIAEGKEK